MFVERRQQIRRRILPNIGHSTLLHTFSIHVVILLNLSRHIFMFPTYRPSPRIRVVVMPHLVPHRLIRLFLQGLIPSTRVLSRLRSLLHFFHYTLVVQHSSLTVHVLAGPRQHGNLHLLHHLREHFPFRRLPMYFRMNIRIRSTITFVTYHVKSNTHLRFLLPLRRLLHGLLVLVRIGNKHTLRTHPFHLLVSIPNEDHEPVSYLLRRLIGALFYYRVPSLFLLGLLRPFHGMIIGPSLFFLHFHFHN